MASRGIGAEASQILDPQLQHTSPVDRPCLCAVPSSTSLSDASLVDDHWRCLGPWPATRGSGVAFRVADHRTDLATDRPAGMLVNQDSWFNMWRIAWVAHQLARDPVRLFDANIHYLNVEHLVLRCGAAAGTSGSPVPLAGRADAAFSTLLVLGSFVFAGLAACALTRRLTGSTAAGILAGIIFAFTPYRFDHYMHLELLWGGWMPLVLLAIHRALDEGKTWRCRRTAVCCAGALVYLLWRVPRDGAGAGRTNPGNRSAVAGVAPRRDIDGLWRRVGRDRSGAYLGVCVRPERRSVAA